MCKQSSQLADRTFRSRVAGVPTRVKDGDAQRQLVRMTPGSGNTPSPRWPEPALLKDASVGLLGSEGKRAPGPVGTALAPVSQA